MNRGGVLRGFIRLIPGMATLVLIATGLGLAFNILNPQGLPMVRKPLRETRAFASSSELRTQAPKQAKAPVVEPPVPKPEAKEEQPAKPEAPASALAPAPKPAKAPAKQKKVQALFTTLKDARALFEAKRAIFIDGRPEIDFEAEHIPGALSLFSEETDKLYDKVLGRVPKDRIIVTYCSDPECTEAINLADALVARGHTKVVILLEGLPGWKDAGYTTEGNGVEDE